MGPGEVFWLGAAVGVPFGFMLGAWVEVGLEERRRRRARRWNRSPLIDPRDRDRTGRL